MHNPKDYQAFLLLPVPQKIEYLEELLRKDPTEEHPYETRKIIHKISDNLHVTSYGRPIKDEIAECLNAYKDLVRVHPSINQAAAPAPTSQPMAIAAAAPTAAPRIPAFSAAPATRPAPPANTATAAQNKVDVNIDGFPGAYMERTCLALPNADINKIHNLEAFMKSHTISLIHYHGKDQDAPNVNISHQLFSLLQRQPKLKAVLVHTDYGPLLVTNNPAAKKTTYRYLPAAPRGKIGEACSTTK